MRNTMQIDLFPESHPTPPAKPPPKQKPESASDVANRLAAEMLAYCETTGLDHKALALELKLWEVTGFLSTHCTPDESMAFAVRLLDRIQENNYE